MDRGAITEDTAAMEAAMARAEKVAVVLIARAMDGMAVMQI